MIFRILALLIGVEKKKRKRLEKQENRSSMRIEEKFFKSQKKRETNKQEGEIRGESRGVEENHKAIWSKKSYGIGIGVVMIYTSALLPFNLMDPIFRRQ